MRPSRRLIYLSGHPKASANWPSVYFCLLESSPALSTGNPQRDGTIPVGDGSPASPQLRAAVVTNGSRLVFVFPLRYSERE